MEVPFALMKHPPFSDERHREEFRRRLNLVDGLDIPATALTRRPGLDLEKLKDETRQRAFFAALDWALAEIRGSKRQRYRAAAPDGMQAQAPEVAVLIKTARRAQRS